MAKSIYKDFPNFSVDPDNQRQHSEATSESKLSRDKTTETHPRKGGFQNVRGGAGNRTRVRAGFFRPSTCVAALSLSRPPHYVQHCAVAAQLLFGFPPVSVTETIGESPSDVRPQFGDLLG